ncbi:MAG TPA: HIT family protein, partial [Candidatus Nanoarchaeia archaeon]|nr:HIT family protein [Candidatus Nanoarchaeia archaeon]
DDQVFAVLDINPAQSGHILLLPKEHYAIMPQLPADTLSHIFLVAKKLSNALLRVLDAKGSNILVANGVAAGQKAQHFMVHIIPRREKDGVKFELPQKNQPEDALKQLEGLLSKSLGAPPKKKENAQFLPNIMKKITESEHKDHHDRRKKHEHHEKDAPQKSAQDDARDPKEDKDLGKSPAKGQEGKGSDINLDDIAKLFGGSK